MTWTAEAVIAELEAAGRTLLALPNVGCRPAGYRHAASELLGAGVLDITIRRVSIPTPSAAAVSTMDATLFRWPMLIPERLAMHRRLVLKRALVDPLHPSDRRHLWPWRKLAEIEGLSHETCRSRHTQGIDMIVTALRRRQAA